jgi:hypothetical protein
MNCYIHPDREAVGTCTSCGRPICQECVVEVQGKYVCRECLSTGRATQIATIVRPRKDRSIALILEILPGFFGFLGIGWIYSGYTVSGVVWLISMLVWSIFAAFMILLTAGFGCICTLPINLTMIAISSASLNSYINKRPDLFEL